MNQLLEVIDVVQSIVSQVQNRSQSVLQIQEGQLPDTLFEIQTPYNSVEIKSKHQTNYRPPTYSPAKPAELVRFGRVSYEVSGLIVLTCEPGHKVPELDTPVFSENGELFGWINDIFGKIQHPYYSVVKVSSSPAVQGQVVFVDIKAKVLSEQDISRMKSKQGTDASNKFDQQALQSESSDQEECVAKIRQRVQKSSEKKKMRQLQNPLKRVVEYLQRAGISDQQSIKKLTIEQLLKLTR